MPTPSQIISGRTRALPLQKVVHFEPFLSDHQWCTLGDRGQNAASHGDFERVFREAVGVVDAAAGSGSIAVDSAFLSAVRGIRFDHQHGTVTIQGTTMMAPLIQAGGTTGSRGVTRLGANTALNSGGTSTQIGEGCSITISGDASIRQS